MHQMQDPREAKKQAMDPIVIPFPFSIHSEKVLILDPTKLTFYSDRTIQDFLKTSEGQDFLAKDHGDSLKPTKLLIAGLLQDENEAKKLLRLYPLTQKQIIPNDEMSQRMFEHSETTHLFTQALYASSVIPDNKVTQLLVKHIHDSGLYQELVEKATRELAQDIMMMFINSSSEQELLEYQELKNTEKPNL